MSFGLRTAGLVGILVAVVATPTFAITKHWIDDYEHPFVGLIVFYDETGEFSHRCSGSLLDPTRMMTAGHCTDQSDGELTARVYFQQDAGANFDPATELDPITGYPETCAGGTLGITCATATDIRDFGYTGLIPDTHDLGLVILDQPIVLSEYAELATAGTLDRLARGAKNTLFTVSGYGLSYRTEAHDALSDTSYRSRLMANSVLTNLNSALNAGYNLQTQGNGDALGGTCSGDSGGPVFLGDLASNTIVAITSFGLNALCRGTDFAYRTDREQVIEWVNAP